ncbi:MAG: cytochrome c [Flavisolibacter sp.]|nr:cytochrome c [Flavisolibacter sp.]MBD0368709.1 cytochrome c [Flavisolibacter sp.]MBD0377588.1 cytochrome c [Flavisolibacter sp.]
MKRTYSLLTLIACSFIIYSCSKGSDTSSNSGGNNPGSCDTVNMRFASDVQPILNANCVGCHGGGLVNGGVTLDNYTGVKTVAGNGKLIGVITHAPGFPAMPQGSPKLPDCTINKIRAWINRGAPNN